MNYTTSQYTLCHGPFCVDVRKKEGTEWSWDLYLVRSTGNRLWVDGGVGSLVNVRAAGIAVLRSLGLQQADDDCPDGTCP